MVKKSRKRVSHLLLRTIRVGNGDLTLTRSALRRSTLSCILKRSEDPYFLISSNPVKSRKRRRTSRHARQESGDFPICIQDHGQQGYRMS
jgi:hypothetical protein